ncbi:MULTISPECIES: protein YgfX [Deefgea]|uniref:Toxin CptA n=1 Tax=Deefgea chitinilytica TaxID=570276 RepID=A0ABS2C9L7_9NEIS|nr:MULTISPECIES: protein YgfX [Deefgea]MBM5570844.1 hypothetical protein [Deefgea chitinilytica]MBM9888073.1 hypothetical protein [Deefgea sp. CFH1-16]
MRPATLLINPVPIWRRGFLLLVFSVAIAGCIALNGLLSIVLLAILVSSLVFYWRKREPVTLLQLHESGEIEVGRAQGQLELMRLLPSSVVTSVGMVLHLQGAERRIAVVLWPDSAPAEVLRQWRVYLRWIWSDRNGQAED